MDKKGGCFLNNMKYLQNNNNTDAIKSQEQKTLRKLCRKKSENVDIINYLYEIDLWLLYVFLWEKV